MTAATASAKFNKSEIFKNAWRYSKIQRVSFGESLRREWALAKQKSESKVFNFHAKALKGASYKQYEYLSSLENVIITRPVSSQFMKRVDVWKASEMIDLAKSGVNIVINF